MMRSNVSSAALAVLALSFASVSGGCTDVGRCELGTEGCFCDDSWCGAGLMCESDRCVVDPCPVGSDGCPCTAGRTCTGDLVCLTAEDRCVPESTTVCEDGCYWEWNDDGVCDDGGPSSSYSACALGNDCTDCGPRENPCTDPDYPVFCPQTPDAPDECWSAGVDCGSIAYCTDDTTVSGACNTGYYYDCGVGGCAVNPCTDPDYPVFCDYGAVCDTTPENCCFSASADCRTAGECHGEWYVCLGRTVAGPLTLDCGATVDDIACVLD